MQRHWLPAPRKLPHGAPDIMPTLRDGRDTRLQVNRFGYHIYRVPTYPRMDSRRYSKELHLRRQDYNWHYVMDTKTNPTCNNNHAPGKLDTSTTISQRSTNLCQTRKYRLWLIKGGVKIMVCVAAAFAAQIKTVDYEQYVVYTQASGLLFRKLSSMGICI